MFQGKQTDGRGDLPSIVQQISCDLRPQRRIPASQLYENKEKKKHNLKKRFLSALLSSKSHYNFTLCHFPDHKIQRKTDQKLGSGPHLSICDRYNQKHWFNKSKVLKCVRLLYPEKLHSFWSSTRCLKGKWHLES